MIQELKTAGQREALVPSRTSWPDGKAFAFTVFDDTDWESLENGPPLYDFLHDLGFRTTKSVWPLRGPEKPLVGGATCAEPGYLAWAQALQRRGFEIGLHNVTYHTSDGPVTGAGIERFREFFGHYPYAMANHTGCHEGIYWGEHRVSGLHGALYNLLTRYKAKGLYQGHVKGSPLFRGDVCRERIKYVRNFVFPDINTLAACPAMPYHDPDRPFVNYWFASAEGAVLESYNRTLAEPNQDRLEAEGGACIMYTHFGKGFYRDGRLDPRFQALMERLSRKNGWFVPVTQLLDYLLGVKGHHAITRGERARLERKWLLYKIRAGST
jgi:hypothetical protein